MGNSMTPCHIFGGGVQPIDISILIPWPEVRSENEDVFSTLKDANRLDVPRKLGSMASKWVK